VTAQVAVGQAEVFKRINWLRQHASDSNHLPVTYELSRVLQLYRVGDAIAPSGIIVFVCLRRNFYFVMVCDDQLLIKTTASDRTIIFMFVLLLVTLQT
jgi:hypothetical protein